MASFDNLYVLIFVVGTLISFGVVVLIWTSLSGASALWTAGATSTSLQNAGDTYIGSLDFLFVMVYFAMHLFAILLMYWLRSHPVMIVVAIFVAILVVIVAAALSNAWVSISATAPISTTISQFPIGNAIMNKLPLYEFFWSLLTIVIGYGFSRSEMY